MGNPSYDPIAYWLEEGKQYRSEFKALTRNPMRLAAYRSQERVLLSLLGRLSFDSVLEIGCGFGRITRLLIRRFPELSHYDALDVSPEQLANAKSYVASEKVAYHCTTFQDYQPNGAKYDLVLASEVLLHVPPSGIEGFLRKMVSLSLRDVVHVDWHQKEIKQPVAPHNFPHDYEGIYRRLGSQIKSLEIVQVKGTLFLVIPVTFKQAIFHATIA